MCSVHAKFCSLSRLMRVVRVVTRVLVAAAVVAPFGCATAPVAPPTNKPTPVAYERKMAWMLQLEDQRILKLPEPPPPPPPAVVVPAKGKRPAPAPLPPLPAAAPDLTKLAADSDPRVRRRAAIAMGRVGLREAVPALTPLLADSDPDVRQAAAFALGVVGDRTASAALLPLLQDPNPMVRGRAAEGL